MFIYKQESTKDTICDECQSIMLPGDTMYILGVGGGLSNICDDCMNQLTKHVVGSV